MKVNFRQPGQKFILLVQKLNNLSTLKSIFLPQRHKGTKAQRIHQDKVNTPKTQMGTTISDNSHFTAFNRSILQCQVTVIVSGFIPRCSDLRLLIRKICPDPCFPACYNRTFRMSVRLFFRNCFLLNCLPGRSAFQTSVGLALLLFLRV